MAAGTGASKFYWNGEPPLFQLDFRCYLHRHSGENFLAVSVVVASMETPSLNDWKKTFPIFWETYKDGADYDLGGRYVVDEWEQLVDAAGGHWC